MIEVIDKRVDRIYHVTKDHQIFYNGEPTPLKNLFQEDLNLFRVIYQKDGEIDLCYKNKVN